MVRIQKAIEHGSGSDCCIHLLYSSFINWWLVWKHASLHPRPPGWPLGQSRGWGPWSPAPHSSTTSRRGPAVKLTRTEGAVEFVTSSRQLINHNWSLLVAVRTSMGKVVVKIKNSCVKGIHPWGAEGCRYLQGSGPDHRHRRRLQAQVRCLVSNCG